MVIFLNIKFLLFASIFCPFFAPYFFYILYKTIYVSFLGLMLYHFELMTKLKYIFKDLIYCNVIFDRLKVKKIKPDMLVNFFSEKSQDLKKKITQQTLFTKLQQIC